MTPKKYQVEKDEKFITLCNGKNLSKNSIKKYRNCLKNYTKYHKLTLNELLEEANKEEDEIPRIARRNIRTRLINFRIHLINDLNYKSSTIKTNMICAKAFYRFYGIEIPEIPNIKLPPSPNETIEFEDLPTKNDIKTAIEGTNLSKHKALYLFSFTTGSARMELTEFTFQQFLDGLKPYTTNAKTPQDIIEQLDGKCEELEVIPIFKMKRHKTEYQYHTATTPECVQFMINYLKSEGRKLEPEDRFFQLTEWGMTTAFKLTNERFKWGKRGTRDYFSSHRIRALHASLIEDRDFANYLEGRKPNRTEQPYFKNGVNRIREKYKQHMHKFTIYARYSVMINSEAYNQLKEELEIVNRENREKDKQLKENKNTIKALQKQIENIAKEVDIMKEDRILEDGLIREKALKLYEEGIIKNDEVVPIIQIARDNIDSETFKWTDEEITELLNKASIDVALGKADKEKELLKFIIKTENNSMIELEELKIMRKVFKKLDENERLLKLIDEPEKLIQQIITEIRLKIKLGKLKSQNEEQIDKIIYENLMEYTAKNSY